MSRDGETEMNDEKCPQCGGPLPALVDIVINEEYGDEEPERGFCSEECMSDYYAEEAAHGEADAYEELLELVNWNLSFFIEPTPEQWAMLLPEDADEVRAYIAEQERSNPALWHQAMTDPGSDVSAQGQFVGSVRHLGGRSQS
jgi:hypothetical protein